MSTTNLSSYPSWYKLNPLSFNIFMDIMLNIYTIFENKNKKCNSKIDPLTKSIFNNFFNLNSDSNFDDLLQKHKQLTMAIGKAHELIMQNLPGWKKPCGGYDVTNVNETIVAEIKNNINTMNKGSRESVITMLNKEVKKGKTAYLVYVNNYNKAKEKINNI